MANINLSQSSLQRKDAGSSGVLDKSLVFSISLVTLTLLVLFGVKLYASSLKEKQAAIESQITEQSKSLESTAVDRIVDFQQRSDVIKQRLENSAVSSQEMFVLMEKLLIPKVTLQSYEYDREGKALSIKAVSDDFKSVSQQVMSFKSDTHFTSVTLGDVTRNDKGEVVFDIKMTL